MNRRSETNSGSALLRFAEFLFLWVTKENRTTSAGREVNELVRINGQWLISVRAVDPQD